MSRTAKFLLLLICLLLSPILGRQAQAKTIDAASCSLADVQAAVNLSTDGDTVAIPNGTCTWTSGITTTKQIWIRAQNYTAVANGTLTRNVTIVNASTTVPLFTMTSGNSFHVRISGIYFKEQAAQINDINLRGSGTQIPMLDDDTIEVANRFGNEPGISAVNLGSLGGVMWDAYIIGVINGVPATGSCDPSGCPQGGSVNVASPLPWYTNSTLGTLDTSETQNWYVEDSTWKNFGQGPDCDDNCRLVMRHNVLDGIAGQTHGLSSAFGGRQIEVYNNIIETTSAGRNIAARYWWGREGVWAIHDNQVAYQNVGFGAPVLFTSIVECSPGNSCANDGSVAYPVLHGTSGPGTGGQQLAQACNPCTGTKSTSTPVSAPVYIWNNCIIGSGHSLPCTGDSGGNSTSSPFFVQLHRDIFIDAGAPPGYAPAPYPHPLRGNSSSQAPAPPTNPQAVVH
jgi:hypothetical protein